MTTVHLLYNCPSPAVRDRWAIGLPWMCPCDHCPSAPGLSISGGGRGWGGGGGGGPASWNVVRRPGIIAWDPCSLSSPWFLPGSVVDVSGKCITAEKLCGNVAGSLQHAPSHARAHTHTCTHTHTHTHTHMHTH